MGLAPVRLFHSGTIGNLSHSAKPKAALMAKDSAKGTTGRVTARTTGRYTPPVPKAVKESPRWVPALMGAFLLLGAAIILLNYLNVLPGSVTNWYLLVGLALITAGFITATQWR